MKTLTYRLFNIGKIPEPLLSEFKSEGIRLSDEGIRGSITYINFCSPGRYSSWRRQWFTASIVLTEVRLAALKYSSPLVDVFLTDERIDKMRFVLEAENDRLLIAFDAGLFFDGASGEIECRFRTAQAQRFETALKRVQI